MYVHAVLFRWKEATPPETIAGLMQAFQAFAGRIPGLVEISTGANQAPRNTQGYTHGAVTKFQDRAALEGYGPHPVHQQFLTDLLPHLAAAVEFDYEVGAL